MILKIYGVKVGKIFYIEETPRLKIRGKASNIVIGGNVRMQSSNHEFWEYGKLVKEQRYSYDPVSIGDDVYIALGAYFPLGSKVGNKCIVIENRAPFLDYRLVQFAFSLPSHYKIRNGITKWALKEVAKRFIPNEIAERVDKRGFSAPVNKWFEWTKSGKYDRSGYRNQVYEDWLFEFGVTSLQAGETS